MAHRRGKYHWGGQMLREEDEMLVLTRKVGEKILIGGEVVVVVLGVRSREKVRLGITAPPGVAVDREEVRKAKEEEGRR